MEKIVGCTLHFHSGKMAIGFATECKRLKQHKRTYNLFETN